MSEAAHVNRLRGLLRRLEELWADAGAPIARRLAPGLPPEQIDALTAPLGLRLSIEGRAWWEWHNGVLNDTGNVPRCWDWLGAGAYRFISLERAIAVYTYAVKMEAHVRRAYPELPEHELWNPAWFPLCEHLGGDVLAIDCRVADGAPTPIIEVAWESAPHPILLPSLTDLVALWVQMLEEGAWTWEGDGWSCDKARAEHFPLLLRQLI